MSRQNSGSYCVVKFVPDEARFEPINIGIVAEVGGRVVTRASEEIDPRIRFADPYADLESLRAFLQSFDAARFASKSLAAEVRITEWLHENGLPNIFFAAPLPLAVPRDDLERTVEVLYRRLVAREFARPALSPKPPSYSAARTALRSAFREVGVLATKVESQVSVRGRSKLQWELDFRYVTQRGVHLVQTATTSLREDLRRREHAFEAFAALIDAVDDTEIGLLAVDSPPEGNDTSALFQQMSKGHGLKFVAGQREFFSLAQQVKSQARVIKTEEASPSKPRLFA